MEFVPEDIVDRVWDRMLEMGRRDTRALMKRAGPFQEELVGFALAYTLDLGPEAGGTGMYLTLVVLEMFRELGEDHVRPVDEDAIMLQLGYNEDLIASGSASAEGLLGMVATLGPMKEPLVMRCVTDTLVQANEGDDPFELTTRQMRHIFLVLKTVVDCLHDSCDWTRITEDHSQVSADAG